MPDAEENYRKANEQAEQSRRFKEAADAAARRAAEHAREASQRQNDNRND